ncbi:MAG: hypothetical protein HQL33_07110, partial [Alphaproteobacteria bacterium]|nr:hypothetical protein [Alphaproteobacteria bacterium]
MIIIGLHFGHDCGSVIMRDGEILFVLEAERLYGVKHQGGPKAALTTAREGLSWLGIAPVEVDAIFVADEWPVFDKDPVIQGALHEGSFFYSMGTVSQSHIPDVNQGHSVLPVSTRLMAFAR